jgi:hypothetical protein
MKNAIELQERNDRQSKTIAELFEKHPEDAPKDETYD